MADWFAPKRYGYGAGPPIAWQGWVVFGVFLAAITAAGFMLLPEHWGLYIWTLVVATSALTIIAARTTKGGWRWRWGEDA